MTYLYIYETINTVIIFIHKNFLMLLGNPSPNLHLKPRQPLICFLSPQISLLSVEFYINMYSFFFNFGLVLVLRCSVMSDSLQPHGLQPTRLLCPQGFSRQEYWNGLPCPPLGDLPSPGIEPESFTSPALAEGFFTTNVTCEALLLSNSIIILRFIHVISCINSYHFLFF